MVVNIQEILYYGRCFNGHTSNDVLWWLCRMDYSIISTDVLYSTFGFSTTEEIKECGLFIPMFQTDIISLEKQFMKDYDVAVLENIMDKRHVPYEVAFNIFVEVPIERNLRWRSFERQKLAEDAVKWCKHYGIPYKL